MSSDLTAQPTMANFGSISESLSGGSISGVDIQYTYPYYPGGWYPAPYIQPSTVYISVPDLSLSGRVHDLERENAVLRGKVETLEKMLAALIGKQSE